jgi:hypothetical protein
MHKSAFTRWFLVWFLAAILVLCVSLGIRVVAAAGKAASTSAIDPRLVVIAARQAAGPHRSLDDHASGTRTPHAIAAAA